MRHCLKARRGMGQFFYRLSSSMNEGEGRKWAASSVAYVFSARIWTVHFFSLNRHRVATTRGGGEFAPNLSLGKCCTQTSEFYTKDELRGAR